MKAGELRLQPLTCERCGVAHETTRRQASGGFRLVLVKRCTFCRAFLCAWCRDSHDCQGEG